MKPLAVGKILSLFITSVESHHPLKKETLILDEKGILTDKHYNKDIQRSVLITSLDSYKLVQDKQIDITYSALGENLLIDYNPYSLPVDSKLKIGTAILQITQPCTLCNHLSVIDKRVPKLLKNNRGVFAKVVQEGEIKEGDAIYLLK